MITIQETELKEGILLGVSKARDLGKPILVSEVHHIQSIEPLSFYSAGQDEYIGERFFWRDPSGESYIVGLGMLEQITTNEADGRFNYAEEEWKKLILESIVFDQYGKPGTGPIMFGGFSFDPSKEKTALWSKYPGALFHIPKFMLTVINGDSYLTTNLICTEDDGAALFQKVIDQRERLLKTACRTGTSELTALKGLEEVNPENWKETVTELIEDLKEGTLKKVVLAREIRLFFEGRIAPEPILRHLISEQKTSFVFAFESLGDCFIGASPERLVKKQGRDLFSACLAGSIRRGKTEEEDLRYGALLLSDEKNLAEHKYVVDMIREAMEENCDTVHIPNHPQLMKVRDIQHLYTPVRGTANEMGSLLSLVERLHPTPALGGLPRKEAIEKIREIESLDRGYYAAPLGWQDYHGNGEFAVAIRSGLIQGKEASLFAGCGVVSNSDAESEYLETSLKFRPMLSALGGKVE